jgi:hypothetical protein
MGALRFVSLSFAILAGLVFVWLVIVSPLIAQGGTAGHRKTPTPGATPDGPTPTAVAASTQGGPLSFTALSPNMLPEKLAYMDDAQLPGGARLTTFYNKKGDKFLTVTQLAAASGVQLPADGQSTMVGNLPGVLSSGLSGEVNAGGRKITYKDAISLTWETPFGTQLTVVSNLPQDSMTGFAATMAVGFTHMASDAPVMQNEETVGGGAEAVDAGLLINESHTYSYQHFVILTEISDVAQEAPTGEPVTLANGVKGVITRGLSGDAPAENHVFFGGRQLTFLGGGGGGGGGGPDYTPPPTPPPSIAYTNGVRLVWSQEGTRLELLSNLPEDQVLAYAAAMQPSPNRNGLVTGAFVDQSILPSSGAMAGYVTSAPSLPTDFYGNWAVTVTEGDGLIIETRYNSNDKFVVVTTRRDDGSPLPQGSPLTIGGQNGVIQDKQKGAALLSSASESSWPMTLQDGKPRLIMGMGGGSPGTKDATATDRTYPNTIDFKDGLLLTWNLSGARITLLTNLDQAKTLDAANSLTILGKDYTIISPANGGWTSQVFADGFDVWAPAYLPDRMVGMGPADNTQGNKPDILIWNPDDPSQFVEVKERAARPGEIVGTPLSSTLLGQPYLVDKASGSFEFRYAEMPKTISYTAATRITVIVDGTWIQLLTSLSQDEAMKIAQSMVKGK